MTKKTTTKTAQPKAETLKREFAKLYLFMKLYLIGFGKGLLLILVFAVLAYIGELQGLSDTASSLVAWIL